jgi:glucan biosynthesis protein C
MCIGIIYAFRRHADRQGPLAGSLSRSAYAAYLIHEVVIITIAYLVRNVTLYPLIMWALVALAAVPLCFVLGGLLRKIPYADQVL